MSAIETPHFPRQTSRRRIATTLILGALVSPWWLLLVVFVGLNLAQSGFTGFCPAERIFGLLGLKDQPCNPTH